MAKSTKNRTKAASTEKRQRRNRSKLRKDLKETANELKTQGKRLTGHLTAGKIAKELKKTHHAEQNRSAAREVLEGFLMKKSKSSHSED